MLENIAHPHRIEAECDILEAPHPDFRTGLASANTGSGGIEILSEDLPACLLGLNNKVAVARRYFQQTIRLNAPIRART
jgi:hypothetical protein